VPGKLVKRGPPPEDLFPDGSDEEKNDEPIPTTDNVDAKVDAKPKKEDILALVPAEGSIDQDAVISKAADLNPPIKERRARGFIAELRSDNVIFEWLISRAGRKAGHHLARSEQPAKK
jgi:hypothetical protein